VKLRKNEECGGAGQAQPQFEKPMFCHRRVFFLRLLIPSRFFLLLMMLAENLCRNPVSTQEQKHQVRITVTSREGGGAALKPNDLTSRIIAVCRPSELIFPPGYVHT
jgi:hypothetical protein